MHIPTILIFYASTLLTAVKPSPNHNGGRQEEARALPDLSAIPIIGAAPIGSITGLVVTRPISVPPMATGVIASALGGITTLPFAIPPVSHIFPNPASAVSALFGPIVSPISSNLKPTLIRLISELINLLQFIETLLQTGSSFTMPGLPNTGVPLDSATLTSLMSLAESRMQQAMASLTTKRS